MAMETRKQPSANRAERLNAIADALQSSWGEWLPLSVRYQAAELADDRVRAWHAVSPHILTEGEA